MNRLLVQIIYTFMTFLHSRSFETCERDVLSGFRMHSNILKSERSILIDFAIRSAKKLMVEPSATVGLGLNSTASHDVYYIAPTATVTYAAPAPVTYAPAVPPTPRLDPRGCCCSEC